MTIISTEISYVEPFTIDALYSLAGERFDFVVHTNGTPGDYWIRAQTMLPCRSVTEGFAVLRYGNKSGGDVAFTDNPPRLSEDFPRRRLFNSPKPKEEDISFLNLKAYEYDASIIQGDPDFKFFLFLDSPTITDDMLYSTATDYKMSCKLI
jgi:FtsP/CotA-like multicopper oxidase with cupredoxin domain